MTGRQTVLEFTLARTDETLTAHGGLARRAESRHGLGMRGRVDRRLPAPGSPRGSAPSVFVDALVLLLQAGGRHLEDRRALERERALLTLGGATRGPTRTPWAMGCGGWATRRPGRRAWSGGGWSGTRSRPGG